MGESQNIALFEHTVLNANVLAALADSRFLVGPHTPTGSVTPRCDVLNNIIVR